MISSPTIGLAFFAGLASFLSPCVFALVPAYVGYLSGRSAASSSGEGKGNSTFITFTHGLAFVAGFTFVFVGLGVLAGAFGGALRGATGDITDILTKVGGVIVVIFGLHMTKIINIPFLNYDLRPQSMPDRNRGYLSSALMGIFFSAGWAPCTGPVLGAIMTLAINDGDVTKGAYLLVAYSLGLGIPFLLAATQIGWVTTILQKYSKVMHYSEIIMGVVLIILGVLLFMGRFETLAQYGTFFGVIDNEGVIGRTLFIGVMSSFLLGLLPAFWARNKGKSFVDYWFIGSGVIIAILIVLYSLGLFNTLIPGIV